MISQADCKRQGVGLYWNWRNHCSEQRDSTNDIRHIPGLYREFRGDAVSDRRTTDRNPPTGRRIHRLNPLIHDDDHQQPQQQKLPRQRRRHRPQMTSQTGVEVTENKPRGFYTSRGVPVTSRVALGDVTTFLTTSRDLSRSRVFPKTTPLSTSTPATQRSKDSDAACWSRSHCGSSWNTAALLESPGRMSCIQLELVEDLHSVSLVQVNLPVVKSLQGVQNAPGWLLTIVCRTYATTDVVRPTAYRRYDLFTTSVANL